MAYNPQLITDRKCMSKLIKMHRELHEVKVWKLAREIGCTKCYLEMVESGYRMLPLKTYKKLSEYLYIPLETLIAATLSDTESRLRLLTGAEKRLYKIGDI